MHNLCGRDFSRFAPVVSVIEGSCVGIRGSGTARAWGEDELSEFGVVALHEDHVAAGAVEQLSENLSGEGRSVLTEDAFVSDAAGDLHSGIVGDLTEDLIETGVVR